MSSYSKVAAEVPPEWFGFGPIWHWERLEQWELTEPFALLLLLTFVWVTKGLFLSVGGRGKGTRSGHLILAEELMRFFPAE